MGRNSREHRRANKHAKEKMVRAIVKRSEEVDRAFWNDQVYEELEKPVFWGYSREFVLRDDIAARNDASKWRSILELVQNVEYSKRKDFKQRKWPSRRWQAKEHRLSFFRRYEFNREVPMKYRHYFRIEYDERGRRYNFIYPWMMVSRRKKSYNTHRKVLDLELERERSYLDERIDQNLYRQAYAKQKRGYYNWRHWNWPPPREKARKKFHQAEIREALLMRYDGESMTTL